MKKRKRVSFDHVLPPDPANFWSFVAGQERTIAYTPALRFHVDSVMDVYIVGTETLNGEHVQGMLYLDRPVIIVRDEAGEPMVTLTLRKIENKTAYIQVSASPKCSVGTRQ